MTRPEDDEDGSAVQLLLQRAAQLAFMRDLATLYNRYGIERATACSCCEGLVTEGAVELSNVNVDENEVTADPGEMLVARHVTPEWIALNSEVDRRGWRICGNRYWIMVRGAPEPHPAIRRDDKIPFETLLRLLLELVKASPES